ncbi:S8 family peptidase [Sporomusa sphaeroides DSM 2875]|uniref:S8 family peptidase n=1 Tax=Sporomusa sphaeroides TaxID=47679 RepID=UPI002030BF49|nr:S8 family peptidase [Sporomusa sphaeroides]MCM0759521.1 S8 family peptidase [Sporomusa sphaeroides DSM 2875]
MSERNLPVKIFHKRTADEMLTEGGPSKSPKWVLHGEKLQERSKQLISGLDEAKEKAVTKINKYKGIPTVLKAKIVDDAVAKSHRVDMLSLFEERGEDKAIGFSAEQELLIRVSTVEEYELISRKLVLCELNPKAISSLSAISLLEPIINIQDVNTKEEKYVLKVTLVDYNNAFLNQKVDEEFKSLLTNKKGIHLDKTVKYSDRLTVHQVLMDNLELLKDFDDYTGIYSIEPMPVLKVLEDSFFNETEFSPVQPVEGENYPVVGILDSGIARIKALESWITGNTTSYPEEYVNRAHGTFVAGIVGFGDLLEGCNYTGATGCKLYDALVIPDLKKEGCTEADLIDNIREAVEKNKDTIKIWNMSLGSNMEISNTDFSDFGTALDDIQDKNNVWIIKSAGNCDNFARGQANGKITRGADSVRALTVGSIARLQAVSDIAKPDHVSPFSRVGPGPANIVKPEVMHYGGNCGIQNGRISSTGVNSFSLDGQIVGRCGTSFSTPRVTAIAAHLSNEVQEEFDPVLLKALMMHSCRYPETVTAAMPEKVSQYGFGVPLPIQDILYNNPHEITLILKDTLKKGEFIDILDFPYPECLIDDDGYYYGQFAVTLVNHPILEARQGAEYCQSNLDVRLGTYDEKVNRDRTKRTIRNPIGRSPDSHNLLNFSSYSKKTVAHEGFNKTEKVLIQYGDKYYPNKKYAVDLGELTPGNRDKSLKAPKKWFLKVEGVYRSFIEKQAALNDEELSQPFCLIVTIRDPLMKEPVYTDVTKLLSQHQFIHSNIKLRQDIRVAVRR